MQENKIKVSQYVDDTTLILDGSKKSLTSSLQILEDFKAISGNILCPSSSQMDDSSVSIQTNQYLVSSISSIYTRQMIRLDG